MNKFIKIAKRYQRKEPQSCLGLKPSICKFVGRGTKVPRVSYCKIDPQRMLELHGSGGHVLATETIAWLEPRSLAALKQAQLAAKAERIVALQAQEEELDRIAAQRPPRGRGRSRAAARRPREAEDSRSRDGSGSGLSDSGSPKPRAEADAPLVLSSSTDEADATVAPSA